MPTVTVDRDDPDPEAVRRAATILRRGGLVAFPTETVYGLGAVATDARAVRRVFAAKARQADNPLIVHVSDLAGLERVAAGRLSDTARSLAARFWPGPLTVVVDSGDRLPAVTTAGLSSVAVRVPDDPVALALLRAVGSPVAAPSANRSGRPSPTTAAHVAADLGDVVDLILDGGSCRVGVESTVVDARGSQPVVLREGAVTREQLGLGAPDGRVPEAAAASPGTRHRHYAPSCPVRVAAAGEAVRLAVAMARDGRSVGLIGREPAPEGIVTLARFADPAGLARVLYAGLRSAECSGVDVVVVEAVPELGIGRAVMDRVRRAAAGSPAG